nr:PepSY-associated TM helix domain-containing protein [Pseudoalteromonas phenolica]
MIFVKRRFFLVAVDSFRKLHFGYFAGLPSRVIWCLIGLTPLIFAITGCYLWLKRRRPKKRAMKVAQPI